MITAERCTDRCLSILDSSGNTNALVYCPHNMKEGERSLVKEIKAEGGKIIVELERVEATRPPPSLVDVVGKHFGFTEDFDVSVYTPSGLYEAWLREKGKSQ